MASCAADGRPLGVPGGADAVAARLSCMASMGLEGNGQEAGLEAARQATSCVGPNAAAYAPCCVYGAFDPSCGQALPFLRADAALVVAVLSDEDDCSDERMAGALADRAICAAGPVDGDGDGVPDGLAGTAQCAGLAPADCLAAECGDRAPADCFAEDCVVALTSNAACYHEPDALVPPAQYVAHLQSLKADPGAVGLWALTGPAATTADGTPVRFVPGERPAGCEGHLLDPELCCDAEGACPGSPLPVCEGGALGSRLSAPRYAAVAEALGGDCAGGRCGQCGEEALDLVARVNTQLPRPVSAVCLGGRPSCRADRPCLGIEPPASDRLALTVTVDGVEVPPEGWWVAWDQPGACVAAVVLEAPLDPGQTLSVVGRLGEAPSPQ